MAAYLILQSLHRSNSNRHHFEPIQMNFVALDSMTTSVIALLFDEFYWLLRLGFRLGYDLMHDLLKDSEQYPVNSEYVILDLILSHF